MNTVTTPAVATGIVLAMSLDGFVACAPDPVDARLAAEASCPRCHRAGLRCRGFEKGDRYRIVLSCGNCRWTAEA